jgi:cellobiose transport system permease protein
LSVAPAIRGRRGKDGEPRELGAPRWFTYLVLAVAVGLSIFPFYWMFVASSNDSSAVNAVPPVVVPGSEFGHRVHEILSRFPFGRAFLNSFIVSLSVALLVVLLSSLAGYAFAKMRFRGRNALFVIVVGTMMIPTQLSVVPLFMIMRDLGWVNSLLALIVPSSVSAFGVFWMRQYIEGAVHDELIQAATVDGANSFRTFWHIVFPVIRPAAAVLGLFSFMDAWNDFLWPAIILNTPDHYTVQVALRQVQNQAYTIDYGIALAGSLMATAPLLLMFVLAGRQLVSGLMEGAVRG